MMVNDWQTELTAQGAHFVNGATQHFGQPQQELQTAMHSTVICDLSHLRLIQLNGADTSIFLQGQVTNDVKLLDEAHSHYTGYCSPKGRLLAFFLAFSHRQSIYLQLPNNLLAPIAKRLSMYVMRSKVVINPAEMVMFGISGPDASTHLAKLVPSLPQATLSQISTEDVTVIKLPSHQHDRYLIIAKPAHALTFWNTLKQACQATGKPCWDWLETQAGIPEIVAATQEQFVPQMLNLDLLGAINFKKGCYTGQEIVARTHYLGSVKRRTYLATIPLANSDATETPQAGDKLINTEQSEVGQVVRVAPNLVLPSISDGNHENSVDVLVELRIEAKETSTVFWHQTELSFKELPYSLNAGA